MPFALIGTTGRIIDVAAQQFVVNPALHWVACPDGTTPEWGYDGTTFTAPAAPPTPPPVIRYVPVSLARERLEAAGKWDALVGALATDMPRLIKLLTLAEGLDPADAEVRGVLTAVGADPDAILAS